ncbi:hypothetical protein EAI_01832 [Harpegnathos saltator]|uniref:Uncharacterized protein n=1 Tax=Harpegnathos saltator TaxID=610380 RepID=E2B7C7_HARSA|nr:hypothetical protein EAI_01832 [Harpegnathos saltator]
MRPALGRFVRMYMDVNRVWLQHCIENSKITFEDVANTKPYLDVQFHDLTHRGTAMSAMPRCLERRSTCTTQSWTGRHERENKIPSLDCTAATAAAAATTDGTAAIDSGSNFVLSLYALTQMLLLSNSEILNETYDISHRTTSLQTVTTAFNMFEMWSAVSSKLEHSATSSGSPLPLTSHAPQTPHTSSGSIKGSN